MNIEIELDTFTNAYIECALWSTNDESDPQGGEPLDKNYSKEDIDPGTLTEMIEDCAKFQAENARSIGDRYEDAGHDFLLTRNCHGCGFWETPDWPKPAGERLTKAAHKFGELNLYVGDDGKIYS